MCRGQKTDLYSLAVMVREILGIDCGIAVGKPGWKPEYTGNNSRLVTEMGEFAFTSFEVSVKSLCAYYRANLDKIDEAKLV